MGPITSFIFFSFSLQVKKKGQSEREKKMYFVASGMAKKRGRKRTCLEWEQGVCLWWLNASARAGEASGLARAVCYRGSPGPPGVPSCWPKWEGLSLGEGEEPEPLPGDRWEANGLERVSHSTWKIWFVLKIFSVLTFAAISCLECN